MGPSNSAAVHQFLSYVPSLVDTEANANLLSLVTMQEVKDVVFQLDSESASGSDGFSGKFYQACWDIISVDLYQAVLEFFVGVPIPRTISSTTMVLLPKKPNPVSFADFRPISLCNFINKIFTRLLCNRLKVLLPSLISIEKSAFLSGRDISDNVLLAQEVLHHLDKRVRNHNVIFKLDMMKAFDRVSWGFFHLLLSKFGFHPNFIRLIMNNLKASWFSVLINGQSSGFFKASRGLKQGDPLSPLLFLLVVDAFSRGLKHLIQTGQLVPYSLPRHTDPISHLCFADDLIIFLRGSRTNIRFFNFSLIMNWQLVRR